MPPEKRAGHLSAVQSATKHQHRPLSVLVSHCIYHEIGILCSCLHISRSRLLKDAIQDPACGGRYERVLGALLCLCGAKLRVEFDKQTQLVDLLGRVAEKVRQAGGSVRQVSVSLYASGSVCDLNVTVAFMCIQAALVEGLESVQNFFQRNSCRLPLSPSLVAKELNLKAYTHTHTHTQMKMGEHYLICVNPCRPAPSLILMLFPSNWPWLTLIHWEKRSTLCSR